MDSLRRGLERDGMAVDVSLDGSEGLSKALVYDYDVIVLDRDLPGMHGDDVCRRLQDERTRASVLMLTASGEPDDRVSGLNLGADDYLVKPFHFAELVARIRAMGRRSQPFTPATLTHGNIRLEPGPHVAIRNGDDLALTAKEFSVLELLMAADGRVVSPEELLERCWDEFADPLTNVVRVTVANLRRKLGNPPVIETIVGAGYRMLR